MTEEDWEYLAGVIRKDSPYIAIAMLKVEDRWATFGLVWEWAAKQEWWGDFCDWIYKWHDTENTYAFVDPVRFPELIANYLEEQRYER